MDEQEYKCCSCGKLAECAEEYATFGASFGCTGTDFRFYCKECFIETFEVGVHKDNRCSHCGKELDFKSEVYSQPCGLYCSFECMMHDIHAVYPLSDLE